jgi:hypothetical protein
VVDEPAGREGVVVGVDPDGVDGRLAGVLHRGHGGVVVAVLGDLTDDGLGLGVADLGEDGLGVVLPQVGPPDGVLGQPPAMAAAGLGAEEVGDEGDGVARVVAALLPGALQGRHQPVLLGAGEADAAGEAPHLPAAGEEDLPLLAVRGEAAPGDDAELQEQQLDILGETLAVGGVRDLDGLVVTPVVVEDRDTAVALEESLKEGPLGLCRCQPHELRDPLVGTLLAGQLAQR